MGGLRRFVTRNGPILTDSGGFQVFSLSGLRKITEEGVTFASHLDGHKIFMGPEESMQIQSNLGSDMAMAFDECVENPSPRKYVKDSVERTQRWLERCVKELDRLNKLPDTVNPGQVLFGINQGGTFDDLRIWHMQQLAGMPVAGIAIGGLAVGEPTETMYHILDILAPYTPEGPAPVSYGRGNFPVISSRRWPEGLTSLTASCRPETPGMVGCLHGSGAINMKNAKYIYDEKPIDPECDCPVCRRYTRSYIHHLFKAEEMLAMRLSVMHNLYFYNKSGGADA